MLESFDLMHLTLTVVSCCCDYISAERNASELVTRLLEMSEKARKTEELLEQMEKERSA